jgi:hypothetical protein
MQQVLFGGNNDVLNAADATEYNIPIGGITWAGIDTRNLILSTSGKIKNLYVELSSAAGTGADDTYTFTLMYDGGASSLTCAIVQGATSGNDTAHEIDVVAGKLISIQCVSSGSPDLAPAAQWSMIFSGSTAKESILGGHLNTSTTQYVALGQSIAEAGITTELQAAQVCPTAGVITNLYLAMTGGAGTGSWTYNLNKNGTPQTLSCAVTVAAPSNSDLAHPISVAAGDTISITCTVAGSITTAGRTRFGVTFVADTDGESIVMGSTNAQISSTATSYGRFIHPTANNASETVQQEMGQVCVLKKFYVLLNGAPYRTDHALDRYTFTVRNNAGSTAITCAVIDTATTSNDTVNTATLAAGDNIALMCVPNAAIPTQRRVYWGLVCYIASGTAYTQTCAGVLSAAMVTGRVVYQLNTNIGGAVTSAGTLRGMWLVALSGAVTSVGAIVYQIGVNVGGAITTAGRIGYALGTYVGGIVNSTGRLMKNVAYVLSVGGAVTLTGTLEVLDVILQAVGGVLSAVGEMSIRKVRTIARKIRTRVYRAIGLKSRW